MITVIEECFERAAGKRFPTGVDSVHPTELQLFGEYIVRECLSILAAAENGLQPNLASTIIYDIKDHFKID